MHTPEDCRHWEASEIRIGNPRDEADLQEKARVYLRRCHEAGLEVIGITDHNFSDLHEERHWFLTHLGQQNRTVAEEVGREPLAIFPGFELDIGFHVVALFEVGTKLKVVDECVTRLGLAHGERFSGGQPCPCRNGKHPVSLQQVLDIVQGEHRGLVIAAHAFSADGIADRDGKHAAEYANPELLAVEIRTPEIAAGSREEAVLNATTGVWNRKRPPAVVLSSDCKRLQPREPNDLNCVGCRFSWIKMSLPSIVALKQAFLDQAFFVRGGSRENSRIRFGSERPEEGYTYPKIVSLAVRGAAFLADLDLNLSPNLNTLIGGRGTGKSTIIEYLRIVLGQAPALSGTQLEDHFRHLSKSIQAGRIRAAIERDGQTWVLESKGGAELQIVSGSVIPDLQRFFPVRILSQREVYLISERRDLRTRLIDDRITKGLDEYRAKSEELTREMRALDQQLQSLPELKRREQVLRTEILDYQTRLAQLKSVEEPLKAWRGLLAEREFLSALKRDGEQIESAVVAAVEQLDLRYAVIGDELGKSPHAQLMQRLELTVREALTELKDSLNRNLERFRQRFDLLTTGEEVQRWEASFADLQKQYETLREDLARRGTDPNQYLEYEAALKDREQELALVIGRQQGLEAGRKQRATKLSQLHAVWKAETELRRSEVAKLARSIPLTEKGEPFVKVIVDAFGDDEAFVEHMQALVKDNRSISRDEWGYFRAGEKALVEDSFLRKVIEATGEGRSPMETFVQWVEALRKGETPEGCPWNPAERRCQKLLSWVGERELAELELWRVPDRFRIELYRPDGSLVGEIEEGLSIGQRCTAVLALLLAEDTAPIVVDQPEDDLDNEFIYNELVPLLRSSKQRRQIIVATHNANIPVNGDAELIVALHTQEGDGKVRAAGGLDQPEVCATVESIMEGGKDAFRRRREKYCF
jgi:ABC-type cobalamin/Fe3+-siderophores transport system ATPase subunit